MVDMNREIKAMILGALPYPPLPVEVRRFDDENRLCEGVVCTSHDLLARLIEEAAARGDEGRNAERKGRQMDVLRGFLADLVKDGPLGKEALYRVLCARTREHMGAYLAGAGLPEVRFLGLDSVSRGDKVHRKMCDYMAAQTILLELGGDGGKEKAEGWRGMEFGDMLVVCRDRLVVEAPA